MSAPFRSKIRSSLANPGLQSALDANYERRMNARLQSYASLPEEVQAMRQRAHRIREEVVANLDVYLEQFVRQASDHGILVHPAANAAEATAIVLEIARQQGARLVAKSKTMVGEEIRLNEALEAAGIQTIETDLGEYIVQLRGEPPAHIITPAVHLRRGDVGRTFQEKLGIPYTEDVPTLTAAARDRLRQVFLEADLGISGVNLGVAENGMLCLLTNEGNGRLVTTLPKVHIALMGLERLVPTMEDLAALLYLLPRSATGQKLTVYANLMRGPRQMDDPDGPFERHLILLDNGRRAVQGSPLREALFCIRCGACLNSCPVFRELGGHAYVSTKGEGSIYPGPIGSALTPALFSYPQFGHLARACSLCGACKEACPVVTDLPTLLLRVRAGKTPGGTQIPNAPGYLKLGLRTFTRIAVSPGLYGLSQRLAGLFSRVVSPRSPWVRLPALTGWGYAKDFPRPAARPFRDQWHNRRRAQAGKFKKNGKEGKGGPAAPALEPSALSPVERFSLELAAVGGKPVLCGSPELAGQVLALLQEENLDTLQTWDPDRLPAGLLERLEGEGVQVVHQADTSIRAGLTGALAAAAESGTLILTAGRGRPLTASLLPRTHLSVLAASAICENIPQLLRLPEVREAASTVLITGPSRTADIEMTMTVGMHGPGRLYVYIVQDL